MMQTTFLILASLHLSFAVSSGSIISFGIVTSNNKYAGSKYSARLTLLYKSKLYKCNINPTNTETEYACSAADNLISYGCPENKQEIFIQNNDNRPSETGQDSLDISKIFITDSLGKKYYDLQSYLCLDEYDCGSNTALIDLNSITVNKLQDVYDPICLYNPIYSFGIKTSNNEYSASTYSTTLTLLYNEAVYKCDIYPNELETEYECYNNKIVKYGCNNDIYKQMFIQNNDNRQVEQDAVIITKIFITDSLGKKYYDLVDGDLCLDEYDCDTNSALIHINSQTLTGITDKSQNTYEPHCVYNSIYNFGITTSNNKYSGSVVSSSLTLLYNDATYECIINPTDINTEYECNGPANLIGYECEENKQEMFIQNHDNRPIAIGQDAVIIANVFITDVSGKQYYNLIDGLCLDEFDCESNTVLVSINEGMVATVDKTKNEYVTDCVHC
eukprot:500814_1